MNKQSFVMGVATLMSMAFASCGEKDYYDDRFQEEKVKSEFEANFVKRYGTVAPDQNWDLSTAATKYASMVTRAGEVVSDGQSETFSKELRAALASVLPEGKDNHAAGGSYTLISQGPFDIYPLYHGKCMQWDLYVNDVKVANYAGIMSKMGSTTSYGEASTGQLTSTGWHIDLPVGTPIFIKLVITKNKTGYASEGQYAKNGDVVTSVYNPAIPYNKGTISNGSLVLPWEKLEAKGVSKPDNLDHIIMFEDARTRYGDADFNDFVLGIKGRDITPDPIDIIVTNEEYNYTVPSSTEKRYMIEDLGSTDDFDFNDIVVDVKEYKTEIHKVTTTTTSQQQSGSEISASQTVTDEIVQTNAEQKAIIRHLGGILPFTLIVGNTSLGEHPGILGDNPDEEYVVEGWNPAENNIKVIVRDAENKSVNTVAFPKMGEVPMIIATDVTKAWMEERVPIPETWWKEGAFNKK